MSKEVRVVAWCDGPHEHRERGVVERRETLDGEPVLLDLCEPCDKAFEDALEQVQEWLRRGVPVAKAQSAIPPKRGRGRASPGSDGNSEYLRTCLEPGCEYGAAPTRSALGQHVKAKHGKTLKDYTWT